MRAPHSWEDSRECSPTGKGSASAQGRHAHLQLNVSQELHLAKFSNSQRKPEIRIVMHGLPVLKSWQAIQSVRECCAVHANEMGWEPREAPSVAIDMSPLQLGTESGSLTGPD